MDAGHPPPFFPPTLGEKMSGPGLTYRFNKDKKARTLTSAAPLRCKRCVDVMEKRKDRPSPSHPSPKSSVKDAKLICSVRAWQRYTISWAATTGPRWNVSKVLWARSRR